jgi:hypothetical protein
MRASQMASRPGTMAHAQLRFCKIGAAIGNRLVQCRVLWRILQDLGIVQSHSLGGQLFLFVSCQHGPQHATIWCTNLRIWFSLLALSFYIGDPNVIVDSLWNALRTRTLC